MSGFELDDDDVISTKSFVTFGAGSTLRVKDLLQQMRNLCLGGNYNNEERTYWFRKQGIEGEILCQQGGGWQPGRVRFRLEFIPDEPEPEEQHALLEASLSPDEFSSDLEI